MLENGRIRQRLLASGVIKRDFLPVVKLLTPDAGCTWLLSELDPEEPDTAFGLCELGMGYPDFGYVSLAELASVRGPLGLAIERDPEFRAAYPLSVYARAARKAEAITEDEMALALAAADGVPAET